MPSKKCDSCAETFVIGVQCCPHCARPSLFPNVDLACLDEEADALNIRYAAQMAKASSEGREAPLRDFESYMSTSSACKGMRRWELERLIDSDTATAGTYYQQINGRSRIPDDDRWDRLRRIADASFFQSYGTDIHFAALSTGGTWLASYGEGAVFFKESMISHRATVFEQNTAMWVNENNGDLNIPLGYRAPWDQRQKLAVAKLGGRGRAAFCGHRLLGTVKWGDKF